MLTNYVYKLRPNDTESSKMNNWLDILRSTYNWNLADRINQYHHQFIQGDYCVIRTKAEACPLTCFVILSPPAAPLPLPKNCLPQQINSLTKPYWGRHSSPKLAIHYPDVS
ncbi:MAG: helix-turn-helix domain-containing protein [Rhizonema sp. PD38]|nr:helix-turn-helix domain-containing protein [Rhizonema sp. PD38]